MAPVSPTSVPSYGSQVTVTPPVTRHAINWLSVTLYVLGILGMIASLGSNGTFLVGQAQGPREMIAMLAVTIFYDGLVGVLPSVGVRFWGGREWLHSFSVFVTYTLCVLIAGLAAIGFAYQNFGDTAAGRGAQANIRATIEHELRTAQNERDGLPKIIATTPDQIAAAAEARDGACDTLDRRGYKPDKCEVARKALATLTEREANAKRADALEARIAKLTGDLGNAPKAASVNPQAEGISMIVSAFAGLVGWNLSLDPRLALALHYFGFIFLPVASGFCLAWAFVVRVLGQRRVG